MILTSAMAVAQKYAFVDSDYIRKNIPAFTTAQEQLDKLSEQWRKKLLTVMQLLNRCTSRIRMKPCFFHRIWKQEGEAIIAKELEMRSFRTNTSMEGELFKKREELVKPIQDEILKAIKDIAVEGTMRLFSILLPEEYSFCQPKYDISDQVLEKLGYNN